MTSTNTHTLACTHTLTCTYTLTCTHTHSPARTHTDLHTYARTHTPTTHTCARAHTHTHTHTCTLVRRLKSAVRGNSSKNSVPNSRKTPSVANIKINGKTLSSHICNFHICTVHPASIKVFFYYQLTHKRTDFTIVLKFALILQQLQHVSE